MIPIDIGKLVEVTLADGVVRHLRYSLGAKKRISETFGNEPKDLLAVPPEKFLPVVLLEGLVEREGITELSLMENLITSQMTDEITLSFIDSFFAPRVAQNLRRVIEAVQKNSEQALVTLENKVQPAPRPAATAILQ